MSLLRAWWDSLDTPPDHATRSQRAAVVLTLIGIVALAALAGGGPQ